MNDARFGRRSAAYVAAGVAAGALVVAAATSSAMGARDDAAQAVRAVTIAVAGVGLGVGSMAVYIATLRRAVRARTGSLLAAYPTSPPARAATVAASEREIEPVSPLVLVTAQLDHFGTNSMCGNGSRAQCHVRRGHLLAGSGT